MTISIARAGSIAAAVLVTTLTGAAIADDKPNITQIFNGPLQSAEDAEVFVVEVRYPPGFSSPSHYHTGDVLLYVLGGEGAMEVDGVARTAGIGSIIEEKGGRVMVMSNTSDTEWLHFVVFQVGPAGEPMIVMTDQ